MSPTTADDLDPLARPPLFGGLEAARSVRSALAAPVSVVAHALALVALIALSSRLAPTGAAVRAYHGPVLYHPPPPPALPLPKGDGSGLKTHRSPTIVAEPRPAPDFVAPVETQVREPEPPTAFEASADESAGSPTGSVSGTNEGLEGGRDGGQAGGMPWGVDGGVVGGTGTVPVANPDRQPRVLTKVAPIYPHDAFVKRMQGKVTVEIVIDAGGRVVRTKIVDGHPSFDDAALAAVRQWVFAPAIKDGQPVPSLAYVPVTFQIL
jgi:protein TonB